MAEQRKKLPTVVVSNQTTTNNYSDINPSGRENHQTQSVATKLIERMCGFKGDKQLKIIDEWNLHPTKGWRKNNVSREYV